MSSVNAICVRCGAVKRRSNQTCRACGFDPASDLRAAAESVLLSIDRYEDGTERAAYGRELVAIGARIRQGIRPSFDEDEVRREMDVIRLGESLPWWVGLKAMGMIALWLSPLLLLAGWLLLRGCMR